MKNKGTETVSTCFWGFISMHEKEEKNIILKSTVSLIRNQNETLLQNKLFCPCLLYSLPPTLLLGILCQESWSYARTSVLTSFTPSFYSLLPSHDEIAMAVVGALKNTHKSIQKELRYFEFLEGSKEKGVCNAYSQMGRNQSEI